MKKILALFLAVGISFSSVPLTVLADVGDEESFVTSEEEITNLSIDDVVERGLKRNSSLVLLNYQLEILDNQEKQTQLDLTDAELNLNRIRNERNKLREESRSIDERLSEIPKQIENLKEDLRQAEEELKSVEDPENREALEKLIEDLKDEIALLEKESIELSKGKQSLGEAISSLGAQLEALEDVVDQLRLAILKLERNEIKLKFDQEEAEVLTELMLKSTFVRLFSMQEQLELTKFIFEQQLNDFNMKKRLFELGLISKHEFEKAERTMHTQKKDIEKTERNFQRELAKLALDLDIPYHEDMKLLPFHVDVQEYEPEKTVAELIENSYALKKAKEDLELARLDLEHLERNGSEYEQNIAKLQIRVEEEKIRQLKIDLQKAIEDLYVELDEAYNAVEDTLNDIYNVLNDDNKLKRQYELGIISKFQYEQAAMQLKQANFEHLTAKMNYYLLREQVNALNAGVISIK